MEQSEWLQGKLAFALPRLQERVRHLRAIGKVNFVTVIVWRIVARGDYDSGIRLEIADGK